MSIKFHLPDFCGNYKMNLYLADTLNEHPEYFYDDIKIASSYGCFPPAAWNGGRTVTGAAVSSSTLLSGSTIQGVFP
mgnify:CR=1 FL=1